MSFSLDLSKFTHLTEDKLEKVVKKSTFGLFSDVIRDIPVLSGRARGSFFVDINKFSDKLPDSDDKTGSVSIARTAKDVNEYKLGDMISFTSNIPYIQRLEDGYSNKSPQGFVSLNAERWQTHLDKQARKNK